jgi:hypothetical protein
MKKRLSRQPKRSRPVSAKVQAKRRPLKSAIRKQNGSTTRANNGRSVRPASPTETRSEKNINPLHTKNGDLARKAQVPSTVRAASKAALVDRPVIKNGDSMRQSENGAVAAEPISRNFNRSWLEWSNAAMAANQRTMEEFMRCRSPIDLLAVSSRIALRSWFNLLVPTARYPESGPSSIEPRR